MRRWLPVLVGALVVGLLAAATGYGVDRAFQPDIGASVQLKTVPATTLAQLGLTAATAKPPAYCELVNAAAEHQVGGTGAVGCPISRQRAEAAAQAGTAGRNVKEAVLARVTGVQQSQVGSRHLAWIVILQTATPAPLITRGTAAMACPALAAPAPGRQPVVVRCGQVTSLSELVLVDARSANVLMTAPVGLPLRRVPAPTRTQVPVGQSIPARGVPVTVPDRAVRS